MLSDFLTADRWRAVFAASAAAFLVAAWFVPIGHDAIWAVWIGREVLHGATLYRDIIEVNPPLWFWLAVPQAAIGQALGLDAAAVVRAFFIAAIALSLYLTPPRYRLPALAAFAVLPLVDFGQREHFTLVAAAPYVFLAAQRASGDDRPRHAILIGLLAALGFALKPHFVIVPVAIELALWRQARRLRPETIALGLCAAAYALAVPLFAPAYLAEVVPQVVQYYGYFTGTSTYRLLIAALALAILGAAIGRRTGSPETRMLALAALAFLPAVALQAKGWSYQTIPVRGFLFLAIAGELLRVRRSPWPDALLVAAAVLCFYPFGVYRNARAAETNQHLADLAPGTTVTALTSNPSMVWPMVDDHKLRWVSRQFCTWQIFAGHDPRHLPALQRLVREEIARQPDIILVDRRRHIAPIMTRILPTLPGYQLRKRTPNLESFVRLQRAKT